MSFDPCKIRTFRFLEPHFHLPTRTLELRYSLDRFGFTEVLSFPAFEANQEVLNSPALSEAFKAVTLAAGISYYKAAVPREVETVGFSVSRKMAGFFEDLYLHGLGEFAWRNKLDLRGRFKIQDSSAVEQSVSLKLPKRILAPMGGGKDSLVTAELLRRAGHDLTLIAVGSHPVIAAAAANTGLPFLQIGRRIDPQLLSLNSAGAYNGHLPITAINSFILVAAALLLGFDTIAMSNERSANVGNLEYLGLPVNHQYSKGIRFERALRELIRCTITPDLNYFSLLRPLSELSIAERFAKLEQYHHAFCSCNTNFRQTPTSARAWCGQCPKCRFVFLALAPFISKAKLLSIFQHNLLDQPSQLSGFLALLGIDSHKPFECVGEFEESAAAVLLLTRSPEWRDSAVIHGICADPRFSAAVAPDLVQRVLTPSDDHCLTTEYRRYLDAF